MFTRERRASVGGETVPRGLRRAFHHRQDRAFRRPRALPPPGRAAPSCSRAASEQFLGCPISARLLHPKGARSPVVTLLSRNPPGVTALSGDAQREAATGGLTADGRSGCRALKCAAARDCRVIYRSMPRFRMVQIPDAPSRPGWIIEEVTPGEKPVPVRFTDDGQRSRLKFTG
jgi:hypothetical protein